mmetsp:Transcript_141793/g.272268  ORF Transcript_141793/g.272268 Transcript_141793/m.272268 type:complete len:383 (-) Transcript_141793:202-1350(-)
MPCSLTATYYVLALGWNVAADIRATPEITATSAVGGDTITNLTQITKLGEVAADKRAAPEKNSGETITRLKDCSLPPTPLKPVDPGASYGYIHDIIGKDGALMLTMMRLPDRFHTAAKKLRKAGIIASQFPAADGYCESPEDIERGCALRSELPGNTVNMNNENHCFAKQGYGGGCLGIGTAACAESHHRALELAQYRKDNWTLILEDDAVPLEPETWQANFKLAWAKIPPFAKIVRLGWCSFPAVGVVPVVPVNAVHMPDAYDWAGNFSIVRSVKNQETGDYEAGFCTTAYMVHRDAIPDMLGLFPCCCGSDCCFSGGLFNNPRDPSGVEGDTWGFKNMVSIDMQGSAESTIGWNRHKGMYQFGPIVQDNREIGAAREVAS